MHPVIKNRIRLVRAMTDAAIVNSRTYETNTDIITNYALREKLQSIVANVRRNLNGHFLALSADDPFKVSYAKNLWTAFDNDKRIKTTLGRYIKRNIKVPLTDEEMDNFCSLVFMYLTPASEIDRKITYLNGDEIVNFYRNRPKRIVKGHETNESCMCNEDADYTKLYALNPEKVSMMVYDNTLRALLWNIGGEKVLDRVYPTGHQKVLLIKKWAQANNIVYRKNIDEPEFDDESEMSNGKYYYLELKHNGTCPYMDTFKFGYIEGKQLCVSNSRKYGEHKYTSTCGTLSGSCRCDNCGYEIEEGESEEHDGEVYCNDCFYEDHFSCSQCNDYFDNDDGTYIEGTGETYCERCINRHFFKCHHCEELTHKDDRNIDSDDNEFCESCFQDQCFMCEECDGDFYQILRHKTDDGKKYLCDSCLDDFEDCECCGNLTDRKKQMNCEKESVTLCEDCSDDHTECFRCGLLTDEPKTHNDEKYCHYCFDKIEYEPRYLKHSQCYLALSKVA